MNPIELDSFQMKQLSFKSSCLKFITGNYSTAGEKRPLACFQGYLVTLPYLTHFNQQSLFIVTNWNIITKIHV